MSGEHMAWVIDGALAIVAGVLFYMVVRGIGYGGKR